MKVKRLTFTVLIFTTAILGASLWINHNHADRSVPAENIAVAEKQTATVKEKPVQSLQQENIKNENSKENEKVKPVETKQDNVSSSTSQTASSNEKLAWYYKPNKDHKLPEISPVGKTLLNKYRGIYHGDLSSKNLYLTFDEGYENGYTPQILDALKASNVKAAFFITGDYLKRNPELVKRMVSEGHIVGNHTEHHPSLPTVGNEKLEQEISSLSNSFKKLTGASMSYLRPPMGEYSERTLKITQDMGYRNVFWSAAMVDWEPEAGTPEKNKNTILGRIHNGAVVLLHAVNKANAEMLPSFIKECQDQGYQFKTLNEI